MNRFDFFNKFKSILEKLTEPLKNTPILAYPLLVIAFVAFLGVFLSPQDRPWLWGIALGAMVIYLVQVLLPEGLRPKAKPSDPPLAAESVKPVENTPATTPPVAPPPPTPDYRTPRQKYLDAVIADNRPLRLSSLGEQEGDPNALRLSLENVYIALNTTSSVEEKEPGEGKKGREKVRSGAVAFEMDREKARPLTALEALTQAKDRRMVLVGFPGTGKSTFIRYLSLRLAQELLGLPRQLDWPGQALLPVAVSLGRFAESLPANIQRGAARHMEEFLLATLKADERTAAFAPHLLAEIKERGGLLLFDGLDEVADLTLRPLVVQAVEDFTTQYARVHAHSRFLVTCRTYSYTDPKWQLTDWPKYELALLNREQIEQFVADWYKQHAEIDPGRAHTYAEKRTRLLAALQPDDRRRLYEVAPYPIILTVMAVVHANYELPDSRAQVYEKCVDLLLEKWQTKRSLGNVIERRSLLEELGISSGTIKKPLREVAFKAHQGREGQLDRDGGVQLTGDLLCGVLAEALQDGRKVDTFLEYCQSANGLLMLQGTITSRRGDTTRRLYAFPHLTFEEYLAAIYLAEDEEDEEKICGLLRQNFDRWREVMIFLGEYLCFVRTTTGRMNGLFELLAPHPLPATMTETDWRSVWLAGDLLTLYRRAFPKPSRHEEPIKASMRRLVVEKHLPIKEIAAAADTLDTLGHLPPDLYEFAPVTLSPSHPITCHISRYPITNAQYARFLAAPDYAADQYWQNLPQFGPPPEYQPLPPVDGRKYRREKPYYWDDPVFGIARPSVPVVGITWYDASAFCQWLQANWDAPICADWQAANPGLTPPFTIRLPREDEWAAAAGGIDPAGRYPWDAPGQAMQDLQAILRRANVNESGIGRTTPVDLYPAGKSALGVWDLAGNVWDWQSNFYDKDLDYIGLRGGSWDSRHDYARVSERNFHHPGNAWHDVGFRVVAAPSFT